MLKYLIDAEAVEVILKRIQNADEDIVEPGRLALLPAYRSSTVGSPGSRLLARHIISSAIAFYFYFFSVQHASTRSSPFTAKKSQKYSAS